MPRIPLAVLFALAMATPLASAGLRFQDDSPVTNVVGVPQVYCIFQFDSAGRERCDVTGAPQNSMNVNEIRFRVLQGSARVFGIVDDVSNPALTRQIATINCVASCVVEFPRQTTQFPLRIIANVDGNANAIVSLSVQSGVGASLV